MVFFNAETEPICDELGYDLILPSAALRELANTQRNVTARPRIRSNGSTMPTDRPSDRCP